MYININEDYFINAFKDENSQYKDNFSIKGLKALFNYFEEYEEDTGEKIQFDKIAICCEYSEIENLYEYKDNYNFGGLSEIITIEDMYENLNENTIVIPIEKDNCIILDY